MLTNTLNKNNVLIADVIRKFNFTKMNLLYFLILFGDLYSNFPCSIVIQKSDIIQKIKNSIMPNFFPRKQHFCGLKIFGMIELFKIFHNVSLCYL